MREGADWAACHAELVKVCDAFNGYGQRASAAITYTNEGLCTARVVVEYIADTGQRETELERRTRQDLQAGFGSAGYLYRIVESNPSRRVWHLELAATGDLGAEVGSDD